MKEWCRYHRRCNTPSVRNAKAKEHWSKYNAHLVSGGPSTQFLLEVSKRIFRQGLGEDISSLFICEDVVDSDATGADVVMEMMVFDHMEVAHTRFISFVHCELVGALVVFMHNDVWWLLSVDVPHVDDSVK
jgi:hypothetical protein